jgi:hypothetical protein
VIQRQLTRLAWLVAAAGIALGAAGLADGIDHPATAGGRGELTSVADRAIAPGLDAATADLRRLADDVDSLGDLARTAIAALAKADTAGLQASIDAGLAQIGTIEMEVASLRAVLAALPGVGPGMEGRLGAEAIARRATIADALPALDGLRDSWTRLAGASVPATELVTHLLAHDTIAGQAVRQGSAGQYAKALATLAGAEAQLAAARQVRDRLAASVDVATLDDWIGRNAAYDAAVRAVWQAMVSSKGRVTQAVRDAFTRADQARKALPPDARALAVIIGDVARGGLNQAVIEIEQVRGPLRDALVAALQPASSEASPEPSPTLGAGSNPAPATPSAAPSATRSATPSAARSASPAATPSAIRSAAPSATR